MHFEVRSKIYSSIHERQTLNTIALQNQRANMYVDTKASHLAHDPPPPCDFSLPSPRPFYYRDLPYVHEVHAAPVGGLYLCVSPGQHRGQKAAHQGDALRVIVGFGPLSMNLSRFPVDGWM